MKLADGALTKAEWRKDDDLQRRALSHSRDPARLEVPALSWPGPLRQTEAAGILSQMTYIVDDASLDHSSCV